MSGWGFPFLMAGLSPQIILSPKKENIFSLFFLFKSTDSFPKNYFNFIYFNFYFYFILFYFYFCFFVYFCLFFFIFIFIFIFICFLLEEVAIAILTFCDLRCLMSLKAPGKAWAVRKSSFNLVLWILSNSSWLIGNFNSSIKISIPTLSGWKKKF